MSVCKRCHMQLYLERQAKVVSKLFGGNDSLRVTCVR